VVKLHHRVAVLLFEGALLDRCRVDEDGGVGCADSQVVALVSELRVYYCCVLLALVMEIGFY
jgi:hypothetical protein